MWNIVIRKMWLKVGSLQLTAQLVIVYHQLYEPEPEIRLSIIFIVVFFCFTLHSTTADNYESKLRYYVSYFTKIPAIKVTKLSRRKWEIWNLHSASCCVWLHFNFMIFPFRRGGLRGTFKCFFAIQLTSSHVTPWNAQVMRSWSGNFFNIYLDVATRRQPCQTLSKFYNLILHEFRENKS